MRRGPSWSKQTLAVETAAGIVSGKGLPAKFVFVDVISQRTFASAFEVSAADVPAVAVISTRKNRFATYTHTFNADGIARFLDDVLAAKQRTRMIQEIPKLVPGGEAPEIVYDEEVEEEFDLADIMGEDVEGDENLNLIFDPILNLYFEPHTNKYYELI